MDNNPTANDGINLFGLADFACRYIRTILGGAVLGAVLAAAYLVSTPPRHEASALVEMAQVPSMDLKEMTNVEQPALVAARLGTAAFYSAEMMHSCREAGYESPRQLAQDIKATPLKNANTIVSISTGGATGSAAAQCLHRIFEAVREEQAALTRPYSERVAATLKAFEERVRSNQQPAESATKGSGSGVSLVIAKDDTPLLQRMDELHRAQSMTRPTRYAAPLSVTSPPGLMRWVVPLVFGALAGAMLGLLVAVMLHFLASWREWHRGQPPGAT